VLACAGAILLGEGDADVLKQELTALEGVSIPGPDVVRAARLRFDLVSLVFEQRRFLDINTVMFLLVDSSPQLGVDFLCVIEDEITLPTARSLTIWTELAKSLQNNFTSQICQMSSTGVGRKGLVKKTTNVINGILMKCPNWDGVAVRRRVYKGVLSDQGTEKGTADIFASVVKTLQDSGKFGTAEAFFFTEALGTPGALHILYDALEVACKRNPFYTRWLEDLRTLLAFFTDKQLIGKFQGTCMPANLPEMKAQAATHVDWKWEFLSRALTGPVRDGKLDVIEQHWDLAKMLSSDSGNTLSSQTIKHMDVVLRRTGEFKSGSHMFLAAGAEIEHTARDLEICDCHSFAWGKAIGPKKRKQMLLDSTGHHSCCMMGRRLPWFIALGKADLFTRLQKVTSAALQAQIARLTPSKRGEIVQALEQLRLDLLEILKEKLEFLDHAPWIAFGAWYFDVFLHDLDKAKALLRKCLAEVDQAIARGIVDKLHRVARRLFAPGALVRVAADAYLEGEAEMIKFPELFIGLLQYCLMPFVERRIEEVHSRIQRVGRSCFGCGVPYVCAVVRSEPLLNRVFKDPEFMRIACDYWRKRSLIDIILRLRYSAEELKGQTWAAKTRMVYQTGIEQEYENTTEARQRVTLDKISTTEHRLVPLALPDLQHQCLAYIRSLFEAQSIFSMPSNIVDECIPNVGAPHIAVVPPHTCLADAMEIVLAPAPEVRIRDADDVRFFQVINSSPGARVLVSCPHVDEDRRMQIVICFLDMESHDNGKVVLRHDTSTVTPLNLLPLLSRMKEALSVVGRWRLHKCAAVPSVLALKDIPDVPPPCFELVPMDAAAFPVPSQIVPVAAPRLLLGEREHVDVAIRTLLDAQAVEGRQGVGLRLDDALLDDVDGFTISSLRENGVVAPVQVPGGADAIVLRPQALDWCLAYGVKHPVPLSRVSTTLPLLRKTKLELIFGLLLEGYVEMPQQGLAPLQVGGARVFINSLHKPQAYFAA